MSTYRKAWDVDTAVQRAELRRDLLKLRFQKQYEEWKKGWFCDDRLVFCNVYEILLEALDAMEKVDNSFVWVAFVRRFNEETQKLAEIKETFKTLEKEAE